MSTGITYSLIGTGEEADEGGGEEVEGYLCLARSKRPTTALFVTTAPR